jgi:Kae1-associated kinase Bud32
MKAWIGGELLHVGAEARVTAGEWYSRPAVHKHRRPRLWRHRDLDRKLTKRRMSNEAKLMIKLHRRGVPLPAVYDVDTKDGVMIIEMIEGKPLIEILAIKQDHSKLLQGVGRAIRRLHREAVTHGDLSTNNIIITPEGEPILIDLGLANQEYEMEGFGIDLHVMHEILRATHPDVKNGMDNVIAGYKALDDELGKPDSASGGQVPDAKTCVKRLEAVKQRVRYHGG